MELLTLLVIDELPQKQIADNAFLFPAEYFKEDSEN